MVKKQLTKEQKQLNTDLIIIVVSSLVILTIYIVFNSDFIWFFKNKNINLLLRTLAQAITQFGAAGLGITIVALYRKESFLDYGLNKNNILKTIFLSVLVYIPYILFRIFANSLNGYLPFQTVMAAKEWISLGFPASIVGYTIIAIAWGFFEGFNYVVIDEKLNKRFPVNNRYLQVGPIACGILCLLIHGAVGITPSAIIETITIFIIIYGMLQVKEYTGNAWGCVFLFLFFWNAF